MNYDKDVRTLLEQIKKSAERKDRVKTILEDLEHKVVKDATIQRVLDPADADAFQMHDDALKANEERKEESLKQKEVAELIKETASEESRHRHYDVVDRKDLAKKINEAKSKNLKYSISRNNKDGYRYLLEVFDPEKFEETKEEIIDIDIDKEHEDDRPHACREAVLNDVCDWIKQDEDLLDELCDYLRNEKDYKDEIIDGLFYEGDIVFDDDCGDVIDHAAELDLNTDTDDFDLLNEELKIYTSSLENFHPSERAEDLWNEIKEHKKLEDLEYALETLYPDGISDIALDDLLCFDEDWIRDLIDLEESNTEDEDIEDAEDFEDEEDFEDDEDLDIDYIDDTDDITLTDEDDEDVEIDDIDDTYEEVEPVYFDEEDEKPLRKKAEKEKKALTDSLLTPPGTELATKLVDKALSSLPGLTEETENNQVEKDEAKVDSTNETEEKQTLTDGLLNPPGSNLVKGLVNTAISSIPTPNGLLEETEVVEDQVEEDDKLTAALGDSFVKNNYKANTAADEKTKKDTLTTEALKQTEEDDEVVDISDDEIDTMLGAPKKEDKDGKAK